MSVTSSDRSRLPRLNAARRYRMPLFYAGLVLAVVGVFVPGFVGMVRAALWLAAVGFLSAALMALARERSVSVEDAGASRRADRSRPKGTVERRFPLGPWAVRLPGAAKLVESKVLLVLHEWPQGILAIAGGAIACMVAIQWWNLPDYVSRDIGGKTAAVLLALAFPLLVLQRTLSRVSPDSLPEAPQLERLVRLPLSACLGVGIAAIAGAGGFTWAFRIEQAITLVILAAGLEMIWRGAVTAFKPWPSVDESRAIADSAIAGSLLRPELPSVRQLNSRVRHRFGISLARSWALSFVQSALVPLIGGIIVMAWLFTGFTTLDINERGVYERLGVPTAVFGPGFHAHLPWPLGTLRVVEIGVVHQLPIEFVLPPNDGEEGPVEEEEELVGAEDPAPESADRLWDDAHPNEGSYLIASEENGRQSFQLVNVDMVVRYQVGVSDEAAQSAAYRISDAAELIQALSGQTLVRYLSRHQLLDLLGESRETLSGDFRRQLQEELNRLSSGIDVLSISIEAIHPPPGAASAYHDVQAAEIRAQTRVAQSAASAARTQQLAELEASKLRDVAAAEAAERVGQARTAGVLFTGDVTSHASAGRVFLLERWFDDLRESLRAKRFVLIDHRLQGLDMPTLDMRGGVARPDTFNERGGFDDEH